MTGATPRLKNPRHARNELSVATAVDHVRPNRRRPDPSRRVRLEHELLRLALRARVVRAVGQRAERHVFVRLSAPARRYRASGPYTATLLSCSRRAPERSAAPIAFACRRRSAGETPPTRRSA